MPYKDLEKKREVARLSARRRRAVKRAELAPAPARFRPWPDDPGAAVALWAKRTLKIPPGHPRAGKPMALPPYLADFICDALTHDESLLCIGRKNAKSSAVAVLLLAHLCGPLRRPGWRAGVASINAGKAAELWAQAAAIALASGLSLETMKAPQRRLRTAAGEVDILPAVDAAGAASSYDLAIIDELGLLGEKHREFVASMRSSVSAKGGRFLALTIHGSGPFVPEILARRGAKGLAIHHYAAPPGCRLNDKAAWRAANPGLGSIKSLAYMESEAARAAATPADQAHFRSNDLNAPGAPSRLMIVMLDQWVECADLQQPPREGNCTIGLDLGGSSSMTAASLYWPETGRLESYGAFPGTPDLLARGVLDGVGNRYMIMHERGELAIYPGRVTPVADFLTDLFKRVEAETVIGAAADRYRKAEAEQALDDAGVYWPVEWRGMGSGPHGSYDLRSFQRVVLEGRLFPGKSLLLESAVADSCVREDGNGNPSLERGRARGRIDALASSLLAIGLGERMGAEPELIVV